ncbi:hypothetical protein CBW46_011075 [Paenibacillus xerothermodurans]|uniref:Uncharacterized protein n=1 Tax=Paenibacillus xerothermodurans TaxID=1977292 RepID=A0A2W1NAQ5_PAEXE|nr:hypothetical protein CBW46_011075 [Paenibacillus xerothermodurans]
MTGMLNAHRDDYSVPATVCPRAGHMKEAALWSAMIFGVNRLMIALVSPFWGRFSASKVRGALQTVKCWARCRQ